VTLSLRLSCGGVSECEKMRELNEIQTFIDDDDYGDVNEMAEVQHSSDFLNVNSEKCATNESDSGIIFDAAEEEKNRSQLSISTNLSNDKHLMNASTLADSGIDSISKIPSLRDGFHSKQSLTKCSLKSSSTATVAVPLRESSQPRTASKMRSKRYSLPDIDKLKAYNETKHCTKKPAINRKTTICDMQLDANSSIPTSHAIEAAQPAALPKHQQAEKIDSFAIDPKLINKFDGLSQSLYYIDENGSPKIRERYIKQQRLLIEKQEQRKREKAARKSLESENAACSCFNFSRLSKKLKELCKSAATTLLLARLVSSSPFASNYLTKFWKFP
jgi:hypothetical protein